MTITCFVDEPFNAYIHTFAQHTVLCIPYVQYVGVCKDVYFSEKLLVFPFQVDDHRVEEVHLGGRS